MTSVFNMGDDLVLRQGPNGFTLMELLVVMTLMSVFMALVAPLGINTVNKARAQTEYVKMQSVLKRQANRAFVSGANIELILQQNMIAIYQTPAKHPPERNNASSNIDTWDAQDNHQPDDEYIFEYITFPEVTHIVFNRNGIPSAYGVTVLVGQKEIEYALQGLWD